MKKIVIAGKGRAAQEDMAEILSGFPKNLLRRMPAYVRSGLASAICALRDADAYPCPAVTGIVIGTRYGCQKTSFDFMDTIIADGPALSSPLDFSHSVNNFAAALIGLALKAEGPAMTIMNGSLSFAGAMQAAMVLIDSGKCPRVLAGCLDEADPRMDAVFPGRGSEAESFFLFLEDAGN